LLLKFGALLAVDIFWALSRDSGEPQPKKIPHKYSQHTLMQKKKIKEKKIKGYERKGKLQPSYIHVYTYRCTFGKHSYAPLGPHFV